MTNHTKMNQRFSDILQELRCLLLPIKGYENLPLVSLEESMIPLTVFLPDIQTYVFMAKQNSSDPPADGLSLDESASICLYSLEWEPEDQCLSRVLNRVLRSKDRQKLNPWCLYLKLIFTALAHLPVHEINQPIYRGVKLDLSHEYPQGKTFIWWGFSSCTASIDVLESMQFMGKLGERTMFVIECSSAKNISKHTYFQNEDEVVILPATRFSVVSCQTDVHGLHRIYLKEIPPPFTLLEPVHISKEINLIEHHNSQSTRKSVPMIQRMSTEKRFSVDPTMIYWNSRLEKLISENESSSSMNLAQEQIVDHDIPIIIEQAIVSKQCTRLDLTNNEITFEGVILLANALDNNSTLTELNLYNNRINDKGVRALAFELSINNSTLKKLNLGFNEITDDGAQHLAQMLKTNRTLTHLWLQKNHITNRGLELLAGMLARHNWSLELLSLASNKSISDSTVNALVDMLKLNQSLQKLDVDECNLTDLAETKLREIVQSKKDFELII